MMIHPISHGLQCEIIFESPLVKFSGKILTKKFEMNISEILCKILIHSFPISHHRDLTVILVIFEKY